MGKRASETCAGLSLEAVRSALPSSRSRVGAHGRPIARHPRAWAALVSSSCDQYRINAMTRYEWIAVILAGLILSACSSPTAPSQPVDASGLWTRTGCEQFLTGCKITMTIMQNGSSLSGTFTRDGTSGGSLTGTVTQQKVSANLVPKTTPDCAFTLTGTISGDQWTGTETFQCTGPVTIGNPGIAPSNFIRTR